ncbi:MAG: FIST N-terminal domain-containing protein [Pseudomonadota bacterium]
MYIASAASSDADPEVALASLCGGLPLEERGPPDFVALQINAAYDCDQVRKRAGALGAAMVHGATSCLGVMTEKGIFGGAHCGMGCLALWDTEGDYGTASMPLGEDASAAAATAVRRALLGAGRAGEAPELVWLSATPGQEEAILQGIESVVGTNTPILGGSAADNSLRGEWQVFDRARSLSDGLVVTVLFPSRPLSMAFQSGYTPTERRGHVTKATGRRLHRINDRPAAEVYAEWAGRNDGEALPKVDHVLPDWPHSILADSTFRPLGREVAQLNQVPLYLLAHPFQLNEDGSLDLLANVRVGDWLVLMETSREHLVSRAARTARMARSAEKAAETRQAAALMIICATCMLAVRDSLKEIAQEISAALDGGPFLSLFSFGEQGALARNTNQHGNLMISCVTFSSDRT